MPSPTRVVVSIGLFTLLLTLGSSPSAAQYDGALSLDWGASDGFAIWQGSGRVFLDTAVATSDLLYGVGDYDFPAGTRSLHFQAVDKNGEMRGDRACWDSTDHFGHDTDESGGEAAILDASGNLLIGGWVNFQGDSRMRALLVRYEIDQPGCTLDLDFSTDGLLRFDNVSNCDTQSCAILGLAEIRPETGAVSAPRTVALLRATVAISNFRYFLVGLTNGGSLDAGFGAGTSGIREIGLAGLGTLRSGAALTVDDQGRILVLVTRLEPNTTSDLDVMALRYTADGDLDTTFSSDGVLPILNSGVDDADDDVAEDLLALPVEGLYMASARHGTQTLALVRIDSAEEISLHLWAQSSPAQFAAQGNDRFLWATEFYSFDSFRTHRVVLTPSEYEADLTYSSGLSGYETYDLDQAGGTSQEIVDFLLWGGRPIVVGNAVDGVGASWGFLMRAENDYIFADGFEGGSRARWWGY